jgi:hypothetical protein
MANKDFGQHALNRWAIFYRPPGWKTANPSNPYSKSLSTYCIPWRFSVPTWEMRPNSAYVERDKFPLLW